MTGLKRLFQRLRDDVRGNATLEFVMMFPIFIIVFLSAFEGGIMMTRHVMLERSLDLAVRDLRLGTWNPPTHQELKDKVCSKALVIPDCGNAVLLELRPVSTVTWQPLQGGATCVDRDEAIQPVTTFVSGGSSEMMLVRACAVFDPVFISTGIGLRLPTVDDRGGYALVATSAFVNEPS